jgi:hypothetical protein
MAGRVSLSLENSDKTHDGKRIDQRGIQPRIAQEIWCVVSKINSPDVWVGIHKKRKFIRKMIVQTAPSHD